MESLAWKMEFPMFGKLLHSLILQKFFSERLIVSRRICHMKVTFS